MILSAIWNKQARVIFLWSLKKLTGACLFQITRKKTMGLRVNNIHGKHTRWLIRTMHKQSPAHQLQK